MSSDPKIEGYELKPGFSGMANDTASDQTMFKGVHWGKAMMWIFLLSDTFIFSCFLISYMGRHYQIDSTQEIYAVKMD